MFINMYKERVPTVGHVHWGGNITNAQAPGKLVWWKGQTCKHLVTTHREKRSDTSELRRELQSGKECFSKSKGAP